MAGARLEALQRMRRQPTTAAGPPWSVPRGAVFLVALLTMACQAAMDVEERAGESVPAVIDQGDLPSIRARGTLRVLVGASGEEEFLPRQGMPASLDKTPGGKSSPGAWASTWSSSSSTAATSSSRCWWRGRAIS